jgi:hypothetical protein
MIGHCAAADYYSIACVEESPARSLAWHGAKTEEYVTPAQRFALEKREEYLRAFLATAFSGDLEGMSGGALETFLLLVERLPLDLPPVDAYVSPVGSICLDWDEDVDNQLSIICQDGKRVAWAVNFRGDRFNASVNLVDRLPQELVSAISKWQRARLVAAVGA